MFDQGLVLGFEPGDGVAAGAFQPDFDDRDWLPTTVPGGVHKALLDAGQIDDPFYADNEKACAWIEEKEWWFRIRFTCSESVLGPDERLRLIFHGLDTYATIWLDGFELGSHQNMFRPASFDVSRCLSGAGAHTIAIKFDPPLARIAGKTISEWGRNPERSPMRKAQFGYGWDWGPRLPTVGVWRPIELRRERAAILQGVHFATVDLSRGHERAAVKVGIDADRFSGSGSLSAQIGLTRPGGQVITETIALDESSLSATAYLTIDSPDLWWTHDLGNPALHTLTVRLRDGDVELDRSVQTVGIRTLELDQSPDLDERGCRFFRFVLNGVPVFARGANWIPCESFIESIPAARYETLITLARDANMTMLRIWGGGIWEHEPFYETCDRLGIMIWQDFMFACAMYPEDDPQFVAEVEAEARYQVSRLRSYPAMALWCGNNENQWLHDMRFPDDPIPPLYGELYYHKILPEIVAELDGHVPYWPGSPFGGDDHNDRRQGNVHNWDVWHGNVPRRFGEPVNVDRSPAGVSYRRYADDMGRFISEFGMHAAPVRETLETVIPEDQRYHHSPMMDWHNKDNPKDKGDNLMLTVTGKPETLEDYIDFSMIAQAEGLKFGIEHFRRRKPHCSGTIVWQLNDCWPVLSWSVLDYYGVGKAGYYYLKRVYSPVLASFREIADGRLELWVSSERQEQITESVTVRHSGFVGSGRREESVEIDVGPGESKTIRSWFAAELGGANSYISVRSALDTFPANRHFFAPIIDLQRAIVQPQLELRQLDSRVVEAVVTAPADGYAYFVHFGVPVFGATFSDNYFDLEPGESKTISISHSDLAIDADLISVRAR